MTVEGPATVLVTDGDPAGRSRSTLAAVRALGASGHTVFVTVSGRSSLSASSRHARGAVRVPQADHPRYRTAVSSVARELGTDLVLPASDPALLALGSPGQELADKRWMWARADEVGIPRLPVEFFADGAALVAGADRLPWPCVVKVARRDSTSAPSAACLRRPDDVAAWAAVPRPLVVQPYVDAPMRALFGVVWDGELVALGHQEYLRKWPPACGVATAAVTVTCPSPDELERVRALLCVHRGIFQLQFVGTWLIDANPRVYGSLPLAVAAGLNLPDIWSTLSRGGRVPRQRARLDVPYRWVDGDVRAIARTAATGDLGALRAFRPRRGTAHSITTLADMRPGFVRVIQVGTRRPDVVDPAWDVTEGETGTGLLGLDGRELELVARARARGVADVPDLVTAHRRVLADAIARREGPSWRARVRDDLLSPAWAGDVDVHAVDGERPRVRGPSVMPLDPLTRRLGVRAEGQWVLHRRGHGLARLDLHQAEVPDHLERVLARCRRKGGSGIREVIELRRLHAGGRLLPRCAVVRRAALVEAQLGGALLAHLLPTRPIPQPWRGRRPRRPHLRARRVVVALSGLDGAGKSTQVTMLVTSLRSAGIPVHVVWARPGKDLEWSRRPRAIAKRLLGQQPEPGVRSIGREGAPRPRSRRGLVGQLWTTVVTAAFAWQSRPPLRFRRGVVVHDRHRLDAAATLEAVYTDRRRTWHQALLRLTPAADVTILLDVPADVAETRKRDAVFNRRVLDAQQAVYAQADERVPGVVRVDGRAPLTEIAELVLRRVLTVGPS